MSNEDQIVIEQFSMRPSNYNSIDVIYCICLPKRKDYMTKVFNHYKSLLPRLNWIDPIMKDTLNIQELKDNDIITQDCKLTSGKIACHLSHLKTLNTFAQSIHKTCLIFEDDIKIDSTDEYVIKELDNIMMNIPDNYNLVNLGRCWDWCSIEKKVNDIFVISKKPLCRHAYIVNQEGAKQILDLSLPMDKPGDNIIPELQKQNLVIYSLYHSNLFSQNRQESGILSSTLKNNINMSLPACKDKYIMKRVLKLIIMLIIIALTTVCILKMYSRNKIT
jgi:GR25 family glycosyltransferase involved in LPS biosynthesis